MTIFLSFLWLAAIQQAEKVTTLYNESMKEENGDSTANNEKTANDSLVVCFSATRTTKPLAEYAADILNADIYEIVPSNLYTKEDLAHYTNGRADKEQNDPSARPNISGSVSDMNKYNTVILGYPIWHGQAPRIISTFLEP